MTDKLKWLVARKASRKQRLLVYGTPDDLAGKYELEVEGTIYDGEQLLNKALELEKRNVKRIKVKENTGGKTRIMINTKN